MPTTDSVGATEPVGATEDADTDADGADAGLHAATRHRERWRRGRPAWPTDDANTVSGSGAISP